MVLKAAKQSISVFKLDFFKIQFVLLASKLDEKNTEIYPKNMETGE